MTERGRPPIPTRDLLGDLRRVADELERKPLVREYKEHGEYSVPTYYDRFGSWDGAVSEAIDEDRYITCSECGQTCRTKNGYAAHYRKQHANINVRSLSDANPEDFGLSPIGRRRADDG